MRRAAWSAVVTLLIVSTSCDQLGVGPAKMENRQSYSLCPFISDATPRLYNLMQSFANRNRAQFSDRGSDAQKEISALSRGSDILARTGGEPILLTVEKRGRFRVSLTNLGLREKYALSVRYSSAEDKNSVIPLLRSMEDIVKITSVQDGVTDRPPCSGK